MLVSIGSANTLSESGFHVRSDASFLYVLAAMDELQIRGAVVVGDVVNVIDLVVFEKPSALREHDCLVNEEPIRLSHSGKSNLESHVSPRILS